MSSTFTTKRPHKKSRAGCQTCKAKKVKCDEIRPVCGFCALRALECKYASKRPTPTSTETSRVLVKASPSRSASPNINSVEQFLGSPASSLSPSTGGISIQELRLMHHYSTFTFDSLAHGEGPTRVMQFALPNLAFENEYLLNGMLGVASIHMQHLLPQDDQIQKQTAIYRAKALSGYRAELEALGIPNITGNNYEAIMLMSVLLPVLFSKDPEPEGGLFVFTWLKLFQGLNFVLRQSPGYNNIQTTMVFPLFNREPNELREPRVVPPVLLNMLSSITPKDPDYHHIEAYTEALDCLGVLYASLRQDGPSDNFRIRTVSWLTRPEKGFGRLVAQKRPRALVILAYYLSLTKLVKLWWLLGVPNRELPILCNMLGPDWQPYLEVPQKVAQTVDEGEIVNLLLS